MDDRLIGEAAHPGTKLPDARPGLEPDPLKGGDVYGWSLDQAALIRSGRYEEVDWVNVADEIESVGNSEYRSLSSNLEIVLAHMLKWDYQAERRSRSWIGSIAEYRQRVKMDLTDSPSLKSRVAQATERGYRVARLVAARETSLPLQTFPKVCPYGRDAIMDRPFVLDPTGMLDQTGEID